MEQLERLRNKKRKESEYNNTMNERNAKLEEDRINTVIRERNKTADKTYKASKERNIEETNIFNRKNNFNYLKRTQSSV